MQEMDDFYYPGINYYFISITYFISADSNNAVEKVN